MRIIKVNAIDSTNSFLKEMALSTALENFTVVVAKHQTSGRGQMNTVWDAEVGKNLTFSVFSRFFNLLVSNHRYLNFTIAVSVYEALKDLSVPELTIKWPNDILSEGRKICGVLIENSLKGVEIQSSIIGIGLNVNEEFITNSSLKAVSLKDIFQKEFDLETVLLLVLEKLQQNVALLNAAQYTNLEKRYLAVLHKKNVPSMFKTSQNVLFMGKIIGISIQGKLQIELSDETIQEFEIKEVSFA
ncbi:biotin--[acetyl-CoA-carboxylase] ligase [Tenacibaculum sp. 190524A02b]|uniref:BirA family transcriptional regulator, biotin operon repressor / biotin---(Acetyl-CoA-carboxylase) ligase n=1 Tax=Tenacibaculum vairaonense TaxID=3137860 RepID=A0ABM9PHI2_9FLAO